MGQGSGAWIVGWFYSVRAILQGLGSLGFGGRACFQECLDKTGASEGLSLVWGARGDGTRGAGVM